MRRAAVKAGDGSPDDTIYHILKDGVAYKDLGADYYSQFNRKRKINSYLKKLKALGWDPSMATAGQPA